MVVRQRNAARAILGFVQACCVSKDTIFQGFFISILREKGLGVALVRGVLSGLCGGMPSWMLDDLVATLRAMFDLLLPVGVTPWVEVVLQDPGFYRWGASEEQKRTFSRRLKEDFVSRDWRSFKAGLKSFCGGKKKGESPRGSVTPPPSHLSRNSIQAGSLPPLPLSFQQQQQQQQHGRGQGQGQGQGQIEASPMLEVVRVGADRRDPAAEMAAHALGRRDGEGKADTPILLRSMTM
ncbi:unnamed protein product [Discosporangium mesarthrocarpum]